MNSNSLQSSDECFDIAIVGSGVAGLSAAVLAADMGQSVALVTKSNLDQATTRWAQGGIAAVLGGDPDSSDSHMADTLAAGAGLCDREAVRVLVDEGPRRVEELIALGAEFDRLASGAYSLAREGGHSHPRVLHAGGAATGVEVERALVAAIEDRAAAIMQRCFATDLVVEDGEVVAVDVIADGGSRQRIHATNVVLASGGAGQLYSVTTNPLVATGDGIAMGIRAGVETADLEFVQFHPTALHQPSMPRPLISEAMRGHGALLVDDSGERFVDELAPRDIVARAIADRMRERGIPCVFLDATGLADVSAGFPTITATLASVGLDPTKDLLPVSPAAHYTCGGLMTDLNGATSLPGLWAAGEVACCGVHGANRLASNSLLDGMVFGARVVEAIAIGKRGPVDNGVRGSVDSVEIRPFSLPPQVISEDITEPVEQRRARLQAAMTEGVGVARSAASLEATAAQIAAIDVGPVDSVAERELANLHTIARATVALAMARTESRGAHWRVDFPETDADPYRIVGRLGEDSSL